MFLYDTPKTYEICDIHPDPLLYELLDHEYKGCEDGLRQAMVYLRQGFMIHNPTFHEMFARLSARKLSEMEILAEVLHRLHGEDDRYYDESNDDTPVFEFIPPCQEEERPQIQQHHVNNDLSAALMRDIEEEQRLNERYASIVQKVSDDAMKQVLEYLKESSSHCLKQLKTTLEILTTHPEQKDFGLGDMHDAWDLDTSNYFDKPNPYFYNPNDKLEH